MIGLFNTWQLNLALTLLLSITFSQFYRRAVRTVQRDGAATIALQSIAGISILFLVPAFGISWPSKLSVLITLAFACIFYALNDRLQTTARKHLEVSQIAILSQLSTVFLLIIAALAFNDKPGIYKIAGIILILTGNTLVHLKQAKIKFSKYSLVAMIASFIFSIAMSIDIGISEQFNLPIYISITFLMPALMIVLTEKIHIQVIANEFKRNRKYMLLTGICWALLVLVTLRTYQLSKVTTIAPLLASTALLNVLAAYIFLHERGNVFKKILASIFVGFGIYLTMI